MITAIRAVLARELLRLFRQKTRLLSAMVRPMIWLLVIGNGIGTLVESGNAVAYRNFIVPGVIGMTILFGAMLSALTTVYDKESGVMRMLIIAPLPTYWMVVCKSAASTLAGTVQALLLCLLLLPLGLLPVTVLLSPAFFAAILLTAVACATLGMVTAAFSRTLENFAATMNFVIFPVFFLSGALYPVTDLPDLLRLAVQLNPFSYGVDLLRSTSTTGAAEFSVLRSILALTGFAMLAMLVSSWRFTRESTRQSLVSTLTRGRFKQ